ncbi:MAG: site-specific integrase [Phycisphaeraceae bacterium]|nr:site-specific integrase [Phycisphaeraceae bacterium]
MEKPQSKRAAAAAAGAMWRELANVLQDVREAESRILAAISLLQATAAAIPPAAPRPDAPLPEAIDAWEASGAARGLTPRYLRQGRRHLAEAAEMMGWRTTSDVTARGIEEWLASRARNGATYNRLRGYWSAFLRWARATKRVNENVAEDVPKARELGGGHVTRAFSPAEAAAIIEYARRDGLNNPNPRRKARDRWLVYLTAWFTGLRRSELRSVKVRSLNLLSVPPRIQLEARSAKARRAETVPLHPELLEPLRNLAAGKGPDDLLFPHVRDEVVAEDIEAAGVPRMVDGRTSGMHSFRKGMATELARAGVVEGVAQALLRHSDPRLTRNVYTDSRLLPLADAVAGMQRLLTSEPGCEAGG